MPVGFNGDGHAAFGKGANMEMYHLQDGNWSLAFEPVPVEKATKSRIEMSVDFVYLQTYLGQKTYTLALNNLSSVSSMSNPGRLQGILGDGELVYLVTTTDGNFSLLFNGTQLTVGRTDTYDESVHEELHGVIDTEEHIAVVYKDPVAGNSALYLFDRQGNNIQDIRKDFLNWYNALNDGGDFFSLRTRNM